MAVLIIFRNLLFDILLLRHSINKLLTVSVETFQFLNYNILIVEVNVSSFRKHISKTEDLMPLTFVCGTSCCSCRLSFSEEEKFLIEFGNVEMHFFPIKN